MGVISKAVRFSALGGPEQLHLEEMALREPAAGEVVLKVAAVGLNRSDSMYLHGHYKEKPLLPSGIGAEAVGTVMEVGPGVDASLVGRRFGMLPGSSMNKYPVLAEYAVVPADHLAALPDTLSDIDAAASWMQYTTAYGALVELGKVSAGDFVLITAASSSVGLAAIQIAKAQGAFSIATTRTSAKREQLLQLGADHVIATEEDDLPARVREITGGKLAKLTFDSVGGDLINALGLATAPGGSIFLYGLLSGKPTPFPMSIFARGIGMFGYSVSQIRDAATVDAMKSYIYDRLADGTFRPAVARVFPFAQFVDAYRYMESNEQVGKIVISLLPSEERRDA